MQVFGKFRIPGKEKINGKSGSPLPRILLLIWVYARFRKSDTINGKFEVAFLQKKKFTRKNAFSIMQFAAEKMKVIFIFSILGLGERVTIFPLIMSTSREENFEFDHSFQKGFTLENFWTFQNMVF